MRWDSIPSEDEQSEINMTNYRFFYITIAFDKCQLKDKDGWVTMHI